MFTSFVVKVFLRKRLLLSLKALWLKWKKTKQAKKNPETEKCVLNLKMNRFKLQRVWRWCALMLSPVCPQWCRQLYLMLDDGMFLRCLWELIICLNGEYTHYCTFGFFFFKDSGCFVCSDDWTQKLLCASKTWTCFKASESVSLLESWMPETQ